MSLSRISRTLGLSITTVSRALGGHSDVSPVTRARVEAESRRIGYQPNQDARRLRLGRADAVGLILPTGIGQFDDPFFLRLLGTIGPALADAGLDLLVSAAPPGERELVAYRRMVESRRVDGFLLARTRARDPRVEYLQKVGIPFVAHGRSQAKAPYAHVDTDGAGAVAEATRRLIGFGHRDIAFITATGGLNFAIQREAGWRQALTVAGLPHHAIAADPTEAGGFEAMHQLLRDDCAVSAVVCATDRLAVGALHALAETGLRAGRDVSVIGFDNHSFTAHTDPPLTTIGQSIEAAGLRMVEMLLALFGGADPATLSEIQPATLIVRGSDGPASPVHAFP
jgi:LacI family transcriptional regulator